MANIKMEPEEMSAKASQLNQKGAEFHEVVTDMGQLVTQLCGAWDGAASDAFADQFARLKPEFQKTETLIQDLAQQVRDICRIIVATDDDIAKRINA